MLLLRAMTNIRNTLLIVLLLSVSAVAIGAQQTREIEPQEVVQSRIPAGEVGNLSDITVHFLIGTIDDGREVTVGLGTISADAEVSVDGTAVDTPEDLAAELTGERYEITLGEISDDTSGMHIFDPKPPFQWGSTIPDGQRELILSGDADARQVDFRRLD